MKLSVLALCKNERTLIPFFLRHYNTFADDIYVWDNQSDDGTLEYMESWRGAARLHVEHYDTKGVIDDYVHMDMKNSLWKGLPGDWFVVVDVDELAFHPRMRQHMERCNADGATFVPTEGWEMIGDAIPPDSGAQIYAHIREGVRNDDYSKRCIFRPTCGMEYYQGCHSCRMTGIAKSPRTNEVKLLHYRWLSKERALAKMRWSNGQLSETNKKRGWGWRDLDKEAAFYDNARLARTAPGGL